METLERGNGKKDKMHEKKDRYNPGRANFDTLRNYFRNSNGSTLGSVRNIHEKYMFMKTEKEGIAGYVSKFSEIGRKKGLTLILITDAKGHVQKGKWLEMM